MAGFNTADADVAQRQEFINRDVPETWDGDVGHDAWSDTVVAADTNLDVMGAQEDEVLVVHTTGDAGKEMQPDVPKLGIAHEEHDQPFVFGAEDETEAIGDLLRPGHAIEGVEDLFDRPSIALLPTPATAMINPSQKPAEIVPARRSARLMEKPQMPAMEKAVRVLNAKMGITVPEEPEMPLEKARREFANSFKTALPDSAIQALIALFRLHMPSITAADEALIAMAGPGGSELAAHADVATST